MAATTMTPILPSAIPSGNVDISGSFTAAGLTIRLSCALTAKGEDTLILIRRNDSGYWERTEYTLKVTRGADFTNSSSSIEIPVSAADKWHVVSTTGFAIANGVTKLNSLQAPSGLASVPSHGSTHLSNGSDPIPLAVAGGASGLMSGTQAAQLEQLSGGVPGETQVLTTSVADSGSSAVAYVSDNSVSLTAGRLWSERNDGVEKFAVRYDGGVIAPTAGPTYARQHTLPDVASDTIVLLAATQTLAAKTLTAPVVAGGLTASGSASNDFSASTGTFKTSTGAVTVGGGSAAVTITAGAASTWSTSAGALTVGGFAGINFQKGGSTLVDVGVTSATKMTLAANIDLNGAAGTGALSLGSMTGATALPTGNLSWTGATTKTASIVSTGSGSSITLTAGAASTWSTSAGALTVSGASGINLQYNGSTLADVGATSSTAITLAANISLSGAAGTGALSLGSMTGDATLPTGSISWTAAATKTLTLSAAGAASITSSAGALTLTAAASSTWSTSAGALTITSAAAATWRTAAGALTVDAAAGLQLGTSTATSVSIGASGISTTVNGNLLVAAKFTVAVSTGTLSKYNNESTAGVGASYIVAYGQDVASSGAGAQNTTLATFTPTTSGLYRVTIVLSAHTNADTVTAKVTYTDSVMSFATTLTPISAVALTQDSNTGTTTASVLIRASTATAIVAKITTSAQTTTLGSAIIERIN